MVTLNKLLYTMIKGWENEERFRRDDYSFDAYEHLSSLLGHKNSSTLRKMAGPKSSRGSAKLRFDDAIILMVEMNDFRLVEFMREELQTRKQNCLQMNLFSKSKTDL